ncbi:MAG: hypothetical protein AAGJ18_27045 [Bacteroidota bacterium]
MSLRLFFIIGGLYFWTTTTDAQSLVEKMGGISTDFAITSDSVTFRIAAQCLIRRAISYHRETELLIDDYGYGFGYQAIHLEFISAQRISERKGKGRKRVFYWLEFFDHQNQLVSALEIPFNHLRQIKNEVRPVSYTYSINLERIPFVLLANTTRINLTKYRRNRFTN